MNGIHFNIWAIIILLGAVQGIFLSVYLLVKQKNRKANKWLAALLIVITLHLFEYVVDITELAMLYPDLIAITYPLLFCMGPFYYLYCNQLLNNDYTTNFKTLLHFLPSVMVLILMLPFYTMPSIDKVNMIKGLAVNDTITIPTGQLIFMGAHVVQTTLYVLTSYKRLIKKAAEIKNYSSDGTIVKKLEWLKGFSLYFLIYFILYFIVTLLLTFINAYQGELDYMLLLIISISIYILGYSALNNPEIFKAASAIARPAPAAKPDDNKNSERFSELKKKLLRCMETERPYLKSELKISELADILHVPAHQLSQLINEEFSVNFYDFINKYRVQEAQKLLLEDKRNYKIIAIAYEVGFNSKATFNRVFKKFTDFTPSDYKDRFSPEANK